MPVLPSLEAQKGILNCRVRFPQGIPGLSQERKIYLNTLFYGMVCWQYNAEGLITGGEIRLSEECKKSGHDKEGSVYRPLVSSAEWQGGTAPDEFTSVWINHESDEVWITEGFRKAKSFMKIMALMSLQCVGLEIMPEQFKGWQVWLHV